MLEDGSVHRPRRQRRREEFIPIENVSAEDLHPDYLHMTGALNPEEALIAKEERDDEEIKELARYEEFQKERSKEEDDRYEFIEVEDRAFYEAQLRQAIARFMALDNDEPEPPPRKEAVKSMGARKPAQGWRGKTPRAKHKKGADTVRKPR